MLLPPYCRPERMGWAVGLLVLVLLALGVWWGVAARAGAFNRVDGEIFGTHYHITYRGGVDADTVRRAVQRELDRLDAIASTWKPQSELMRYNRAQVPERFAMSADLSALLELGGQIQSQTGGAFSLRPDGGPIDLSAIAKGFAVDRVVDLLERSFGITSCLVDIGGEVKARGDGPSGDGWRVGVYMPASAVEVDMPTLHLRDTSVATSGSYFKGDHILDPNNSKPVVNELLSVSVIHPHNATADALATALYVMGPRRGMQWASDHAIHAIFILKDGTQYEHVPAGSAAQLPATAPSR